MPASIARQPASLMMLLMNITRPLGSESANAPTKGASTMYEMMKLCCNTGVCQSGDFKSLSRAIAANNKALSASALENNLHVARRTASARLMSIIKADGYGHGMLRVAEALSASDGFALLD